jgi:hypothetical protein
MTDWNESTLKAAASWKAFKEGRSLFDAGKVAQAASTAEGWTGSIRSGTKLVRLSVKVPRAGLFDVKCSCPENQASGAVCAHAVATGLALLAGSLPAPSASAAAPTRFAPAMREPVGSLVPLMIRLAPNWQESLQRGRLTVTLEPDPNGAIDPADSFVTAWATQQGIRSIAKPLPLSVDRGRLGDFLSAAIGHPRIFAGKTPFAIESDHTLPMADPVREGDLVSLTSPERPILIGGQAWQIEIGSLNRFGPGPVPEDLLPAFEAWSSGRPFKVALKDLLRNAPRWEDWISIPEDSWLGDLRMVVAEPKFHLFLEGSLTRLEAQVTVSYPGIDGLTPAHPEDFTFPRLTTDGKWETRHLQAEAEAIVQLEGKGLTHRENGKFSLSGEPEILPFLALGLDRLPDWIITQTPKLRDATRSVELIKPRFEEIGSGEDWLAFDYSFQGGDGSLIPRSEVLQWLRSGRSVRNANGKRQILDEEAISILEPLLGELDIRQEHGHFVGPKAIGELIRELRNKENKELNSLGLTQSTGRLPITLEKAVPGMLRSYQKSGAFWIIDRLTKLGGALLADDMGLGKTIQTIISIEHFLSGGDVSAPALVVTPTSLLGNWKSEFQRFAPGRTIRILHGGGRDSEREKVEAGDVVITSYGTLARDLAWHLRQDYEVIAIDEASLVRNPDTDHAKALAKLKSPRRIALSGTPVENSVRDLWSIFRFIQPGWLGSREQFKDHYEAPLQEKPLPKAPLERLRLKTAPFILRRTKEQVATDLPSKLIIDDYCELSTDQRQVYRDILNEGGKRVDEIRKSAGSGPARMQLLTTLLRLRQTCCDLGLLKNERLDALSVDRRSSKLERLLGRVDEAIANNHRILVFSQFQAQLRKINEQLVGRGIGAFLLDGQTRNRQELVDRFQKADGPPIFLISLKAGGYGLNLTAADTVIHFDPWWNPAAEMQATDRAHRIGQTKPVTVYRLLTRGTVEEKVVRLQASKRELAQATFDEEGLGQAAGWSDGELRSLLES